jgi:hypothetical protein
MESSIATFLERQVDCELLPARLHASHFVSTRSVCFRIEMRISLRDVISVQN